MQELADEINERVAAGGGIAGTSANGTGNSVSASSSDPYAKLANVVNLEFSYGYNDGQMSPVYRGFMTEYNIDFSPAGATLTIEGRSNSDVAFKDPQSVTYKGMTIEEIIRSIAKEEGWIIEDDSIEPIAPVEESTVYSISLAAATNTSGTDGSAGEAGGVGGGGNGNGFTGDVDERLTADQRKMVTAANQVGCPGQGYCAKWVSLVYQKAFGEYPGGHAFNMYDQWCKSSNKSDILPGMIVAVKPSGATGSQYGHVGIYIGNGNVRHSTSEVHNTPLDSWIAMYGPSGKHPHHNPVKWGWLNGKNLSINTNDPHIPD